MTPNRSLRRLTMSKTTNEMLALDFDGVICASSGESSYTSILAACNFWPNDVSIPIDSKEFNLIKDGVHQLRPIVETGYENMLLVRLLYNELKKDAKSLNISNLMKTWSPALRDSLLAEYGSDKETMIKYFGDSRDALIAKDLKYWVGLNEIYSWAKTSMGNKMGTASSLEYSIITTKQARFVDAILTLNGIALPPASQLFDLENPFGSKSMVLKALLRGQAATSSISVPEMLALPLLPPNSRPLIHFVEDRLDTLLAILADSELRENTKLYLVEHGYNTIEQRAAGRMNENITMLTPNGFEQLLERFRQQA